MILLATAAPPLFYLYQVLQKLAQIGLFDSWRDSDDPDDVAMYEKLESEELNSLLTPEIYQKVMRRFGSIAELRGEFLENRVALAMEKYFGAIAHNRI